MMSEPSSEFTATRYMSNYLEVGIDFFPLGTAFPLLLQDSEARSPPRTLNVAQMFAHAHLDSLLPG